MLRMTLMSSVTTPSRLGREGGREDEEERAASNPWVRSLRAVKAEEWRRE
jgi:hypothetical protein